MHLFEIYEGANESQNHRRFINSRNQLVVAIIGLLLFFFYNSKNLNCIGVGALSLF